MERKLYERGAHNLKFDFQHWTQDVAIYSLYHVSANTSLRQFTGVTNILEMSP